MTTLDELRTLAGRAYATALVYAADHKGELEERLVEDAARFMRTVQLLAAVEAVERKKEQGE